jgi:predicted dehydrogenase
MKTYNIGIIGYGGFGRFLHHWWDKMEGVNVLAISDHRDYVGRSGLKHYKSYADLIADDEIDIISIATPPSLHVDVACDAMRNDKHVLLEKPIAVTNEGAEKILRTQRETGVVMTIDHMLRYNPIVKALKELSLGETFGKLRHVSVNNYAQDEGLPKEHWFWDKEISGGIFIEHGVHFFDIVNSLTTQKIVNVSGVTHKRTEQQEDQVSATVLYDGGLIANHYHSFSGPGFFEQTTIRLTYDLARIEIEGWVPMKGTIKALVNKDSRDMLNSIPNIEISRTTPLSQVTDVSRPEGWGESEAEESTNTIHAGGIAYTIDEMVEATFEIQQTKSEVYGKCLQDIMRDMITKIENPSHKLTITAEDAFEALKTAVTADENASKPSFTQR